MTAGKLDPELCRRLALFVSDAMVADQLIAAAELGERLARDERVHAQERMAVESGWVELDHPALTADEVREAFRAGSLWWEGWTRSAHGQSREKAAAEYAAANARRVAEKLAGKVPR